MLHLLLNEATAARRRIPVYLVDDTDGTTPVTGATFAAGDIKISKNGGAEANHAGTVTELAGGLYYYEATSGELDTVGFLTARFTEAGARVFVAVHQVVSWDPYRATLAKGTDITGFNDLSTAQVNAEVDTALADYDAPTSAELVSEINSVQSDIAALNNLSAAQVNAEVDTALADVNLDHLVGTATGIPAVPAGTFLDQIMDNGVAAYDRTTDSLQAIRDRGDAAWTGGGGGPTAADIADAVWDEATAGHVAAGTFGEQLKTDVDAILADTDSLDTVKLTAGRASNLDELGAGNIPADIDQLKADLPGTITRNTAYQNFTFMMVDSADHVTPMTGLTVTAERSIDGAAFAAAANAVTEISAGWYKIDLAASDLNGANVALKFTAAGADSTNIAVSTQPT